MCREFAERSENMKTQYKSGMIVSYVGFIISTISGFILPPMIIAHLGQELNGVYNALTSFSVYFGMMDLGLGTAIIRYVAKYRTDGEDDKVAKYLYVMRNVYFLICGITFLSGCVVTIYVPQIFKASIPEGYHFKAQLIFFISLLSVILTIFDNLYYSSIKAYEQFFVSRFSAIMRVVIRVTLIVLLLEFNFSVVAISFADFLATLIVMMFRMIYTKRKLAIKYMKPEKGEIKLKEIFGYSFYIVIYSLTEKVFWQLDKVVLGIMAGGVSVTIYTIGSQISSSISSVSSTVSSMYLPHAVKLSSKKEKYTSTMAQMARYQLFVIVPVLLGFIFYGKQFLELWVGEGYDESYRIAIVLIATLVPVLLQSYGEALLKALNIQKVYASAMTISVLCNIGLTVSFIPPFGALGAAIASAIVNVLRCIFMAFYYQRTLGVMIVSFIKKAFSGMIISVLIMAFSGYLIMRYIPLVGWIGLLVKVSLFVVVYVLSFYFNTFNDYEIAIVSSLLKRLYKRKG